MKRILLYSLPALAVVLAVVLVLAARIPRVPAQNPDPNHTHADLAVWVEGQQLDFSAERYMMTEEREQSLSADDPTKYIHLHDGIGHVIHKHKPRLTFNDFLNGIGFDIASGCITTDGGSKFCDTEADAWRFFVNGRDRSVGDKEYREDLRELVMYDIQDTDALLLTYGATEEQVREQLEALTDDACLYSKTCPWRGNPPAENCIADPAVPCVAP